MCDVESRKLSPIVTNSGDWSRGFAEDVVEFIRVDANRLWERPPLEVINVQNGLLDTETRELRNHSPEHLSPIQLPVEFDLHAECPAWNTFAAAIFPPDAMEAGVPWEIPARLMVPDTSSPKAELFLGGGGNGKSRYLTGIMNFLGRGNVTAWSLQHLESNRFASAHLYGKLANICSDLPNEDLKTTAIFKAITGGDMIMAEHKFKRAFSFTPYARLMFSANHVPRSVDSSDAFYDRWRVTRFERCFRGSKEEIPAPVLDARLAAPKELSGLLNRALEARLRIRQTGLSESDSMRRARRDFQAEADQIGVWLEDATFESPEALVQKSVLLSAYNADCMKNSRPVITANEFGRRLKERRTKIKEGQRRFGGMQKEVWIGISIRSSQRSGIETCAAGDGAIESSV